VFGHALYEHLLREPEPAVTAFALVLPCTSMPHGEERIALADGMLAQRLDDRTAIRSPREHHGIALSALTFQRPMTF
jgi:hypothetical protein